MMMRERTIRVLGRIGLWAAMLALAACGAIPRGADGVSPTALSGAAGGGRLDTGPWLGAEHPAVTFVIFENFECRYCMQMQPVLDDLIGTYGNRVRFVFKPYVTATLREGYDPHQHGSHRAAAAALAAARQGRFKEMSQRLFENTYRYSDEELAGYAREIGLDMARFETDRRDAALLAEIDSFKTEATALNVQMTPAFLVGDTRLEGRVPRRQLADAIEAALGRSGAQPIAPVRVEAPAGPRFEDMIFHREGRMIPRTAEGDLKEGDLAPDFSLKSVDGKTVSLSDYRGRKTVVLSFVPGAFTPVCSGQWPRYASLKPVFDKMDVQVVGITTDNQPAQYGWVKGMEEIEFPVLSDFWPHGEVAKKYGVLRPESGMAERAVFIVDKAGRIRFMKVYDINESPPTEDVLDALRTIK